MKRRMLMISYRAPYPITSGEKIRMFQNIIMLADTYDIDLLFLDDNNPGTDISQLKNYCKNIITFRSSKIEHYLNTLKGLLFNKLPLQVNYYYNKVLHNWVKNNIHNYDIVFCNHLRTAQYIINYDSIKKVIDCVDAITMNLNNAINVSNNLFTKILLKTELKRVKKFEKEVYSKFDKKFIISNTDKEYLKKIGIRDLPVVINNYVRDLGYSEKVQMNNREISFIGKMSTEPNVNAIRYFIKEIYPYVKKHYSDLVFNIIGGSPTEEIKKYGKLEGINVTGFVEDPAEILNRSKVVIAPMVSGSGIQNKIIEAMLLGKVVITTFHGAKGLKNLTGEELIICKNTEEFIEKLLFFLDDKNIHSVIKVGKKAREYILENYSFNSIQNKLINSIKELED